MHLNPFNESKESKINAFVYGYPRTGLLELALEQARYEAARARRQYDAVDPDNRLVASELERRWNEQLAVVRKLEEEFDALTASPPTMLSSGDRERLLTLGADLDRV